MLSGKGWYNYGVVGGKVAAVDPWVGTMLTDYRRRHAIVTRDIPSQVTASPHPRLSFTCTELRGLTRVGCSEYNERYVFQAQTCGLISHDN